MILKQVLTILFISLIIISCTKNNINQKATQMEMLNELKEEINDLKFSHRLSNYYVKDYLLQTITEVTDLVDTQNKSLEIENHFLGNFYRLEENGWDLKDTEEILGYWIRLGTILKINNISAKINQFHSDYTTEEQIKKLLQLKLDKKINHEMPSTPIFYKEMKKMMDESIDNVIKQLKINNNIDEMLLVFEKDIDKIIELETIDYSFGDTEDRETIGEFYMEIMDIIGIKFSRGLLRDKFE